MNIKSTLTMAVLLSVAITLWGNDASSQQKQQVSLKAFSENTKVTGHNFDVGDVPNHIVRAYEAHRAYTGSPPTINEIKFKELWERGITDLTDGNGNSTAYIVYLMENGDKIFARAVSVVKSVSGKAEADQVGMITGGTGQLASIRGNVKGTATFNIQTGFNENQYDIEYWMEK